MDLLPFLQKASPFGSAPSNALVGANSISLSKSFPALRGQHLHLLTIIDLHEVASLIYASSAIQRLTRLVQLMEET